MARRWFAALGAGLLVACHASSSSFDARARVVDGALTSIGFSRASVVRGDAGPDERTVRHVTFDEGPCHSVVVIAGRLGTSIEATLADGGGTTVASGQRFGDETIVNVCDVPAGEYALSVSADRSTEFVASVWSSGSIRLAAGGAGTCERPLPLPFDELVMGDTWTSPSDAETGSCAGSGAPERVHRLIVDRRDLVSFELNSQYRASLHLRSECASAETELDCRNPTDGAERRSRIQQTLEIGTYYVIVDGVDGDAGRYRLVARSGRRELERICQSVETLESGTAHVASLASGRLGSASAMCGGDGPEDIYRFRAPVASRARIRLETMAFDSILHVRSSCADPEGEVACNDDHPRLPGSFWSGVLPAGDYFAFVDSAEAYSAGGEYGVLVEVVPSSDAARQPDEMRTLDLASQEPIEIDTLDLRDDFVASCGGADAPDQAFRLELTERRLIHARLEEAMFPAAVSVRRIGGDGAELGCVAETASSVLALALDPGTYALVVDGQAPKAFGRGSLIVDGFNPVPGETACRRASVLQSGTTIRGDTTDRGDRFGASCAGGARSDDEVYRIVLRERSHVQVHVEAEYDSALQLLEDCTMRRPIACNDDFGSTRASHLEATLDAGTYYVVVDGYGSASRGTYELQFASESATETPPPSR